MKKIVCAWMILAAALMLVGCGSSAPKPAKNTGSNTVQNVLNQQMKNAEESSTEAQPPEKPTEARPDESKTETIESAAQVDVDLTKLSSTMIYSEVYNMMFEPEAYVGKTVRMGGQFALYLAADIDGEPIPDQMYFACVIADATACCSQGLEFVLAGEHTYPDDYPELDDEIVVSGTFEMYEEDGFTYCHLVDAVLE